MVNVLIPTQPDDLHSVYVKLALEQQGHCAVLWYTQDYPENQTHAFKMQANNVSWESRGINGKINELEFDVVWNRRARTPLVPAYIHQDDRVNAERENQLFYEGLWCMVAPSAVWVNSREARSRANCKAHQLKLAAQIGMQYPKTLISNDPEEIKSFIVKRDTRRIIYKTFAPTMWFEAQAARLTYAAPVVLQNLPTDRVLQAVPGIFQEYIEKAFEVRVTYFDDYYIAVKIDSQAHHQARDDWRVAPAGELALTQIVLPPKVDNHCRQLMKRLGIVFGCFDFIVSPKGEYVFLEVNEQGQFLWIEDVNPAIPMLDTFVRFIGNKGRLKETNKRLICNKLATMKESAIEYVAEAVVYHNGSVLMKKDNYV